LLKRKHLLEGEVDLYGQWERSPVKAGGGEKIATRGKRGGIAPSPRRGSIEKEKGSGELEKQHMPWVDFHLKLGPQPGELGWSGKVGAKGKPTDGLRDVSYLLTKTAFKKRGGPGKRNRKEFKNVRFTMFGD